MTTFQEIIKFFNSKKSNKVYTRSEYFMYMKYVSKVFKYKESYLDTVRCYLQRANYLTDEECGVYRKIRPISKNITLTKLQNEAYPKSIQKQFIIRRETRKARQGEY